MANPQPSAMFTDACAGNDQTLTAEKFLKQINGIHELPTLSTISLQLGRKLQDINTSASDVAAIIQHDQSLVTKLLKLVNSAFFGFSNKVASVQHALMLLGFNTVRNAVVSIDVINAMQIKNKIKGFDITSFWGHAIGVAVIGKYLDQEAGGSCREDIFTAGIIHDIGKLVMAHYFSDRFQEVWETMHREQLNFWEAEHRYFPLNHADIGAELARRWHLPEIMQNVIGFHHTPAKSDTGDHLVHIIHTADALFHVYMENDSPTEDWPIHSTARQLLRPLVKTAGKWMPDLVEDIKTASKMLMED